MDLKFLGAIFADFRGSAGGITAVTKEGKTTFRPRKKPKLSQTPKARFTRAMYATLEMLWCMMPQDVKDAWLNGCRVPYLSGRDLWTRINWHQVAEYDEYRRLPGGLAPLAPVKVHLAGNLPVPPECLAPLGGPLQAAAGSMVRTARYERYATGNGATLQTAVANAYAAINAMGWAPSTSNWRAWHRLWWGDPPFWPVIVWQGKSSWATTGNEACQRIQLQVGTKYAVLPGAAYQSGVAFAGAQSAAAAGWQYADGWPPNQVLGAGALECLDRYNWSPLGPTGAPPDGVGFTAEGLAVSWKRRG